jgi:tetratricopeptide (TPR) repeat protein
MAMFQAQWADTEGFAAVHPLSKAIELLMAVTLLFSPLAFGTTEPWSEKIVIVLAGLMLILFLLKFAFSACGNIVWHWAYIPVVFFLLLVGVQLLPLPTNVISILSPHTVTTKTELLGGLFSENFRLGSMTISFYPHATYHDLRLVLAVAAVFFVTLNTFKTVSSIKRLLAYIATIGGVVALLSLAQFITQTDKIYWLFPLVNDLADAGPFINHSNFAQFMNLSIGAAVARLLIGTCEFLGSRTVESAEVMDFLGSREARPIWGLLAVIVLGVAAIFVSLSRGGIVSLLLAAAFTTCLINFGSSQKGRAKVIVLVVLAAFACILYIGFDAVYDRMATLSELDKAQGGRDQIIKDIFAAWTRFPWFGTGLGTHSVVYPMFDSSTISNLAGHAENEYAQAIEETGLIGFLFLTVFGALVCRAFVHNIRQKDALIQAASYGLGFGLLAILLHSFTDFGQHLPANAFLSVVSCAILLSLAKTDRNSKQVSVVSSSKRIPRIALGTASLLIVGSLWTCLILQAEKARITEAHWSKTSQVENQLEKKNWLGSDEEFVDLLSSAQAAVEAQPGNAKTRHWLNVYRWRSISRIIDPSTGDVLLLPETIEFTRQIVADLKQACILCPTFGPSYSVLGELQVKVLGDPNGINHIRTGYQLAPCDATACFAAASLDVEKGLVQQATEKLSRAVELDAESFDQAVELCLSSLNDPNLALNLAGDNVQRLSRVANQLADWDPNDDSTHRKALAQVRTELESLSRQPEVTPGVLASLARISTQEHEIAMAIDYYRRALVLDYGHIHWRYQRARLLASQNQISEAIHEAKICLRLDKTFSAAQRLIEEMALKVPNEGS